MSAIIQELKQSQGPRKSRYLRNLELYELRKLGNLGGEAYYGMMELDGSESVPRDRLRLVHSAVESIKSSIYAPQKPKPQFQTLGATWQARRKAYKLDRICEGILNQPQGEYPNLWAFALDWATDAPINGTAVMKVTADKKRQAICHEAIPHVFMFVDPQEGRTPRNFWQIAPLDRDTAVDIYGSKVKNALDSANTFDWLAVSAKRSAIGMDVIEQQFAWRLPWGKDKPGRYVAVIGGHVVDEAPWDLPAPPFVFLHWIRHRHEFWGNGIADEAAIIAEEASDLDMRLAVRARLAATKRIYVAAGSVANPSSLVDNEAVSVTEYDPSVGAAPQETLVPPFSDSEVSFKDRKVSHFWDCIGVSQVSAAARREQGISSGIGLMTLNDTKAGRQLTKGQAYENVFVNLAQQHVWRNRELAEADPEYAIKWPGKRLLMQVKWTDTEIEDDLLSVSVAPASSLPHDPAGRQEMVQQLYNAQIISKDTARSLIGWPDLDTELDMENSELEYIDMLIDMYLDAEEDTWDNQVQYQAPEGYIGNKMGALRRFSSSWFRARIDQQALTDKEEFMKAEFNIGLLTRYMSELSALIDQENQTAAALAGNIPMPAAPEPQPQG